MINLGLQAKLPVPIGDTRDGVGEWTGAGFVLAVNIGRSLRTASTWKLKLKLILHPPYIRSLLVVPHILPTRLQAGA